MTIRARLDRIARRWADARLIKEADDCRTDCERLDTLTVEMAVDFAGVEQERDEIEAAYFDNLAVLVRLHGERTAAKRENGQLTLANVRLVNDRDELADELGSLRADYDRQAAENLALHTRCAALTDQVEAYERGPLAQMAVYPPARATGTLAADKAWHSHELRLDAVSGDVDEV